jgi:hypothetical protein
MSSLDDESLDTGSPRDWLRSLATGQSLPAGYESDLGLLGARGR